MMRAATAPVHVRAASVTSACGTNASAIHACTGLRAPARDCAAREPELDVEPLAVHQSRRATHVRYAVTC